MARRFHLPARPEIHVPAPLRRGLWAIALIAAAVLILAAPIRGWWSQRSEISGARSDLAAVEVDNEQLQVRLDRIGDPTELERIARRDLGLVREGEESYTVLPPVTAGMVLPPAWPFDRLGPALAERP